MRSLIASAYLVLFAALLAGCATAGAQSDPLAGFRDFAREDLTQALALAEAAKDEGAPYRARCYATLLAWTSTPSPLTKLVAPKGLMAAFELAAEIDEHVRHSSGPIPEAVQANCGYLRDEILRFVLRTGAKLAPVPGLGAAGSLLGR